MAKFLNTTAINYHLEQLINLSNERLILISPYLKVSQRIKELLEDKNRLKIDIRIVYGKSKIKPEEESWFNSLTYVKLSYCDNLHAKCYINENACIISSLNLYEFSQVNNNEMGVYATKEEDFQLFSDAYSECKRIIRISQECETISVNKEHTAQHNEPEKTSKISTSKLAKKLKISTTDLLSKLVSGGILLVEGESHTLTAHGVDLGGELKTSKRFGDYFVWPESLSIK